MIHIRDLSVQYGAVQALQNVSLDISSGECVLVTGPSGCGKSTLGKVLSCLIPQAIPAQVQGHIQVAGLDPLTQPILVLAPHVGMVFQRPASQLLRLRVEDEVAFGPRNLGLDEEEVDRRVEWALGATGLTPLIALRILVVLVAVHGLTGSVDIASIAGLLERAGLHGLGFSVGVAINLLPALQQSALNAWRSLKMRGGFRKQRWRGLRLLAVTVITGALSRAEEIALAAEARAFSPERARSMPVKTGKWDWVIAAAGSTLIILLVLAP